MQQPSRLQVPRRLLPAVAAIVCAAALAQPAVAAAPQRSSGTFSGTAELTGVCPFPVTFSTTLTFNEIDFVDGSGAPTMILIHATEQDTFTANGKTLTGLPYTTELRVVFDSGGDVVHVFTAGIIEKVPLADGRLFISAGRLDFAAREGNFAITPDVGRSGNLGAFCAALAG